MEEALRTELYRRSGHLSEPAMQSTGKGVTAELLRQISWCLQPDLLDWIFFYRCLNIDATTKWTYEVNTSSKEDGSNLLEGRDDLII